MLKLKRIFSLFLILAVLMSLPVFAEENTTPLEADYTELFQESYLRLKALGIVDKTFTVSDGNGTITRGEFVRLAARLINGSWDGFSEYKGISYEDVAMDSDYADAVYYLTELGVLSGTGNNRFRPEEPVTYGAAIKILVKLTGSGIKAEKNLGGYPHGYITMAYSLDINKGVSYSPEEKITLIDALTLISNTAKAEVFAEYADYKGQSLLEKCHNIYFGSGVITRNGNINKLQYSLKENSITVNGKTFVAESNDYNSLVGYYCDYFYKEESGVKTLLYATEKENRNNVLVLSAEKLLPEDAEFNLYTIMYLNDADKKCKVKLSDFPVVIYNGLEYKEYDAETFNIESGNITLLDNNYDDRYDTVIIEETTTVVTAAVAGDFTSITGKDGNTITLDEKGVCEVFDGITGKRISLSDVKNGDVLSCAVSKDGKYVKIYRSRDAFGGEVTTFSDDNDFTERKITVNDTEYGFTKELAQKLNTGNYPLSINLGASYTFKTDVYGKIAEVSLKEETYEYAYLVDAGSIEGGVTRHFYLRIFLENEVMFDAYVSGNIKLNGESKIDFTELHQMLFDSNGKFKRQLVKVKTDEDGNLKDIMFATANSNSFGYLNQDAFSLDFASEGSLYKSTYMSFDGRYNLNANSVIFSVPNVTEYEDGDYKILKASSLNGDTKYNVKLYGADSTLCAEYAVVEVNNIPDYDIAFVVVDKVKRTSDGNLCVTGISRGKNVSYTEEETGIFPAGLKNGDVIRVAVKNETVRKAERIVSLSDYEERTTSFIDNGSSKTAVKVAEGYDDAYLAVYGELYGVSAKAISTLNPTGADRAISSHSTSGATIYVTIYDVSEKTVTLGSMNDVVPTLQPALDGSVYPSDADTRVLLYRRFGYIREIVVVRP